MSTDELESICEGLANQIAAHIPRFQGFDVRADAGEAGMIYVALRQARGEAEIGEKMASRIEAFITGELDRENHPISFAISLGQGRHDLLLQLEFRPD